MVRNGIFWTIGEQLYIIDYHIMSYRKIKVYRVETMNIGISQWKMVLVGRFYSKNGVSRKCNLDKYYGTYCTR